MIAAARADVAAVEQELLGAQPHLGGFRVDDEVMSTDLLPRRGGMHIDLNDARIGCDPDVAEAWSTGGA